MIVTRETIAEALAFINQAMTPREGEDALQAHQRGLETLGATNDNAARELLAEMRDNFNFEDGTFVLSGFMTGLALATQSNEETN